MTTSKLAAALSALALTVLLHQVPAAAQSTYPGGPPPDIDAEPRGPVVEPESEVLPQAQPRGTLPVTGDDLLDLALIGGGAVAVGAVLSRRRRQAGSGATPSSPARSAGT